MDRQSQWVVVKCWQRNYFNAAPKHPSGKESTEIMTTHAKNLTPSHTQPATHSSTRVTVQRWTRVTCHKDAQHLHCTNSVFQVAHSSSWKHNTREQCACLTVKGLRLKITANDFVCTVAWLPGSPEVAVMDLSNPFSQHVILSLLPLSSVCQRDRGATKSKRSIGQNAAAVTYTVTLPTMGSSFSFPSVHYYCSKWWIFNALFLVQNTALVRQVQRSGSIYDVCWTSFLRSVIVRLPGGCSSWLDLI